jgi:hypothetical protein
MALAPLVLLRRAFLFMLVLAALSPAEALAYQCSRTGMNYGPSLIWMSRTIPYWVSGPLAVKNVPHDQALAEVQGAFHTWESVSCTDLMLPFEGEQPGLKAGYDPSASDNKNVVVFIGSGWAYDQGIVAVTTNSYSTQSGIVFDSDIEVNNTAFTFVIVDATCQKSSGYMDLRNAVTHEVGHLLGLDHPPNLPQYKCDAMFASAPPCEIKKRTLAQDDIDGICSIYPKGQPNHQCFPPNGPTFKVVSSNDGLGGCTSMTSDGAVLAPLLLAVMGALGLSRRAQRPRSRRSSKARRPGA